METVKMGIAMPHPGGATRFGHKQYEAFALMKYATEDGWIVEWIWNSRDGVTPFIISTPDGKMRMSHIEYHHDRYMPNFVPPVGSRIFVNLTRERAIEARTHYVNRYWEQPGEVFSHLRGHYSSKEEAVKSLAQADLDSFGPNSPDLIVVPEGWVNSVRLPPFYYLMDRPVRG